MDIAALSIIKSQSQVQQNASIAILKKVLDTAKEGGGMANKMLGAASSPAPPANLPHLGNNLDTRV